jgi:hypothetical protein
LSALSCSALLGEASARFPERLHVKAPGAGGHGAHDAVAIAGGDDGAAVVRRDQAARVGKASGIGLAR